MRPEITSTIANIKFKIEGVNYNETEPEARRDLSGVLNKLFANASGVPPTSVIVELYSGSLEVNVSIHNPPKRRKKRNKSKCCGKNTSVVESLCPTLFAKSKAGTAICLPS